MRGSPLSQINSQHRPHFDGDVRGSGPIVPTIRSNWVCVSADNQTPDLSYEERDQKPHEERQERGNRGPSSAASLLVDRV